MIISRLSFGKNDLSAKTIKFTKKMYGKFRKILFFHMTPKAKPHITPLVGLLAPSSGHSVITNGAERNADKHNRQKRNKDMKGTGNLDLLNQDIQ